MKKFVLPLLTGLLAISMLAQSASAAPSSYVYKYDKNNRLTAIVKDNITRYAGMYDKNGNLLKMALYSGVTDGTSNIVRHSGLGINNYWFTATLNWNDVFKPDKYNVYQNNVLIGTTTTNTFSTGTLPNGTYVFGVAPVINGVEGIRQTVDAVIIRDETGGSTGGI